MSRFIGKEVLGQKRLLRHELEIEEWGGSVLLQELDGEQIAHVRKLAAVNRAKIAGGGEIDAESVTRFERLLVEYGWVDESGNRIIDSDDGDPLISESARIVNKMATKISEMSGLSPSAISTAKKN